MRYLLLLLSLPLRNSLIFANRQSAYRRPFLQFALLAASCAHGPRISPHDGGSASSRAPLPRVTLLQALHTINFSFNNISVLPLPLLQNASHVQSVVTSANPVCFPAPEICNSGQLPPTSLRPLPPNQPECRLAACARLSLLIPPRARAQPQRLQLDAGRRRRTRCPAPCCLALTRALQVLGPWLAQACSLQSLDVSRNPDICSAGVYLLLDALLPCSNMLTTISIGACGLDSEFDPTALRSFAKLRRYRFGRLVRLLS